MAPKFLYPLTLLALIVRLRSKDGQMRKNSNDVHSQASHMPLPKAIARCTSEAWLPLTLSRPVGNIKVATSLHSPPF